MGDTRRVRRSRRVMFVYFNNFHLCMGQQYLKIWGMKSLGQQALNFHTKRYANIKAILCPFSTSLIFANFSLLKQLFQHNRPTVLEYIAFVMSNKIKKSGPPHREDLEQICQEMAQNKEQIASFCSRNRMKFPLITHRYPIFHHVPTTRLMHSLHDEDNPEFRKFQNELMASHGATQHQEFQRKSSICRIVFSKSYNKNPALSLHSGLMHSTDSKISLLNRRHLRRRSEDKTNDFKMNQYSTKHTHLQNFINSIDHFKSSKDSLAYSMQMDRSRIPGESRFQLLSINRMSTINPNAQLLQTLRGKNLHIDRSAREASKRSFNPKDLNRISFYKNADGIISPKKPEPAQVPQPGQLFKTKELPIFQPWQHPNQQQQDYLSQFQK